METLNFEKQENKRGTNVQIHNYWIRHSQKASGEVFNSAGNAISTSSLSPEGVKRAVTRGMNIKASKDGAKGYTSTSPRTQETFDGLMQGTKRIIHLRQLKKKLGSERPCFLLQALRNGWRNMMLSGVQTKK
ncbi:MAG: hypothetical protein HY918_04885 [Candidatus Doudnabacteria bacterium]|nr:hypothetical protein [Candidatus Doudnabacteria bacterium]